MRVFRSGMILFALFLASSGVVASSTAMAQTPVPESPEAPSSITVHARSCDAVPADGDWYTACHDSPAADLLVAVVNQDTADRIEGTTDVAGNVVFDVPSEGTWEIQGVPGEFVEESFIYCSGAGDANADFGYPIVLEGQADVVCDYYFVPDDMSTSNVEVNVNLCIAAGCTELPEAIEPADGIAVEFSDVNDDTAIGSCTTGETAAGACEILVEGAQSASVTVDPDTIPDGYTVEPNPSVYEWTAENPEVPILLYPVDGIPPADDPGQDATPAPTEVPPVPLPVPLALELPSALSAGTCADVETAESAEELNDLTIVEGDAVGAPDALVAASGYTNVPMTVDDLLADDYSVVVFAGDDPETVIACGAIGGVPDQDGALSVGLTQVDDSGAAGVVYLAPADDGSETGVSVFLVPDGLIPEEEGTPAPLG